MAKMKHAMPRKPKQRPTSDSKADYLKAGPFRSKAAPAPRPEDGIPRPSKAFREALAKEYGVERVPDSLKKRTELTMLSLPDDMPGSRRPFYRNLRRAVAAAALLVFTCTALFALNRTHPQLAEALPGLGQVFTAINGSHPSPSPEGTPAPTPTPQPVFQPVTALNKGDFPGLLTVDDAWSDGKYLWLEISVCPSGELEFMVSDFFNKGQTVYLQPGTLNIEEETGETYVSPSGSIHTITSEDTKSFEGYYAEMGLDPDTGYFHNILSLELDNLLMDASDTLTVSLSFPDMALSAVDEKTGENPYHSSYYAGFEASFTLPVNASKNRQLSLQTMDNEVTLQSIDYSPSQVSFDTLIPYLGNVNDLLLAENATGNLDSPLNIAAELTCLDAQGNSYTYSIPQVTSSFVGPPELGTSVDVRYVFQANPSQIPRDLRGPLVLTIYELPENAEHNGILRRVMAEFTVDMSTGRAWASENYQAENREMASTIPAPQRLQEALQNGVICWHFTSTDELDPEGFPGSATVMLAMPESEAIRSFLIYAYDEAGDIIKTVKFIPWEDHSDGFEEDWNSYTSYLELLNAQEPYVSVDINISYPPNGHGYQSFAYLQLVDGETNQVLIPDLAVAHKEAVYTLCGPAKGSSDDSSVSSPLQMTESNPSPPMEDAMDQ